jgi:outer membrane protein assembly factor BamB
MGGQVVKGGQVFTHAKGSRGGSEVHCLDAAGQRRWAVKAELNGMCLVGDALVGSLIERERTKALVSLSATTGERIAEGPPMTVRGVLNDGRSVLAVGYDRGGGSRVALIDLKSMKSLWEVPSAAVTNTRADAFDSLSLAADNSRVLISLGSKLLALRISDGQQVWSLDTKPLGGPPPCFAGTRWSRMALCWCR